MSFSALKPTAKLYLSRSGDSFSVETPDDCPGDIKLILQNGANSCQTHRAVYTFLKTYDTNEKFKASVELWHKHHFSYEGHFASSGKYHLETIDKMRDFVYQRMLRKASLHFYFDKMGSLLGRTFFVLNEYCKYPIIGSIPAAMKALLGTAQMTSGLFFSSISLPFTAVSENARIIFSRSFKHIGNGVCNIAASVFQAVPFLGTALSEEINERAVLI